MRAKRVQDDAKVVIKVLLDRNAEAQARQNREQAFLSSLKTTGTK
jgi:hypothetical protein